MKKTLWIVGLVVFSVCLTFAAGQAKAFKIAAIFQTAIEEPWDGVIHQPAKCLISPLRPWQPKPQNNSRPIN